MPHRRTYTIREAADLVGIGEKAMRRRVERGTVQVTGTENRGGKIVQVIAGEELVRVGLLQLTDGADDPAPPETPSPKAALGPPGDPPSRYLVDQFREVVAELATRRLLEAQAGERERQERAAREALEGDLHRARAREAEAKAQLAAEEERRRTAEAREASIREELETLRRAQSEPEVEEVPEVAEATGGSLDSGEPRSRQRWWNRVWGGEV